ncbi:hypothetical protein M5K25_006216 [Dendrobium thyrsiflorum]|uniref:Uncharacterized protein n=1 Tax=Dendrobium thyrsiflorum TaxID=117978 RepID=A0ABD0VAX6_DENTH
MRLLLELQQRQVVAEETEKNGEAVDPWQLQSGGIRSSEKKLQGSIPVHPDRMFKAFGEDDPYRFSLIKPVHWKAKKKHASGGNLSRFCTVFLQNKCAQRIIIAKVTYNRRRMRRRGLEEIPRQGGLFNHRRRVDIRVLVHNLQSTQLVNEVLMNQMVKEVLMNQMVKGVLRDQLVKDGQMILLYLISTMGTSETGEIELNSDGGEKAVYVPSSCSSMRELSSHNPNPNFAKQTPPPPLADPHLSPSSWIFYFHELFSQEKKKTILLSPLSYECMADPECDHGFIYNHQGLVDILQSSFFDLNLKVDNTVDNYVDRILFTLAPSIEEHLPSGHWRLIEHPPVSPHPVNFPWINTLGVFSLLVAPLGGHTAANFCTEMSSLKDKICPHRSYKRHREPHRGLSAAVDASPQTPPFSPASKRSSAPAFSHGQEGDAKSSRGAPKSPCSPRILPEWHGSAMRLRAPPINHFEFDRGGSSWGKRPGKQLARKRRSQLEWFHIFDEDNEEEVVAGDDGIKQ